jgi:hypothetical protein
MIQMNKKEKGLCSYSYTSPQSPKDNKTVQRRPGKTQLTSMAFSALVVSGVKWFQKSRRNPHGTTGEASPARVPLGALQVL